jgi:hypothetical protein
MQAQAVVLRWNARRNLWMITGFPQSPVLAINYLIIGFLEMIFIFCLPPAVLCSNLHFLGEELRAAYAASHATTALFASSKEQWCAD